MRPVRILLVAVALLAVALTGWAFGARGGGYTQPEATPAAAQPATPTEPAADPGAQGTPKAPAGSPSDTTRPAPVARPRILGFGSEPVLPKEGGFWQLPAQAGMLTLVLDAPNATKVELLLSPTGTNAGELARRIGQDTNGDDGWLFTWHYPNEPLLGHLTVKATGPGGTAQQTVGIYHPGPAEQP